MALADVAQVVGGRLDAANAEVCVDSVVTDSRLARPGALFVALPGDHADGHTYVSDAFARSASAAIVVRATSGPAVVVADPLRALAELARRAASELTARVIGVTGSTGKTSTKDLLAAVLEPDGGLVAATSSYNNEVGLPLTVLEADRDTRYLVLEYSARHGGDIAYLCGIARPHIAVVLNVGSAHIGEFGSRAAIAAAKAELVEALAPDGVAVLNIDDPLVAAMAGRTTARVVTVGQAGAYCAEDISLDERARASFTLRAPAGTAPVGLRLVGRHHVGNAVMAAAAAGQVGIDLDDIATRLSAAGPRSRWRMEVRNRPDGVTVLNDAYNANPESMEAALSALVTAARGRRTWAVLGPMLELGDAAPELHREVGRLCASLGVSRVVAVGRDAREILSEVDGEYAGSVDDAIALLRGAVRPADLVLVKGSRAAGLERVALALAPDDAEGTGS